jgi:hypothetical protein
MRILTLAAMAVWCAALPAGVQAATAKQIHRSHRVVVDERTPAQPRLNYFGNAAADGNNANSMSGSNSPADNAVGRTSGSGFH